MLISIITPTSERESQLKLLYEVILSQEFKGSWEWLIYDNSLYPSSFFQNLNDRRVKYIHDESLLSIGEKRQKLNEASNGDIIVHFDDDDYYAPQYIQTVIMELENHDFFSLSSWFCYTHFTKQFFYWSTSYFGVTHFLINPLANGFVQEHKWDESWKQKHGLAFLKETRQGYGFSYAYRKKIAKEIKFEPVSHKEDTYFFDEVEKKGFKIKFLEDKEGLALHIIHDMNTSSCYPQYCLPSFIGHKLFPHAQLYLQKYLEEECLL